MIQYGDELCFRYPTRCALCRMRLPNPDIEKPKEEAWEDEVLGICNLSTSEERPRIFTTRSNLKDLGTFFTPRSRSSIKFYSQSERRHGKIAHIVHKCCWKLIMLRTSHSLTSIYRFAQSRYPLFDTGDTFDSEHDTLMDFTNDTIADLSNTNLKKFLEQLIMVVPPEIRLIISKYCSPCLTSSLHTAKRIQSLDISGAHSLQTVVKHRNDNHYLEAAQTSIFGVDYLSSIAFNKSKGVSVSSAKGVIFTIGRYGLRALRIVYADNSTSAWLGDAENGWTGVIYSNNIQELHMIHENLKLLWIDLKGNAIRVEAASRVFWDNYLHLPSPHHHYVLDTNPDGSAVVNFPGWRVCEYLPFVDDNSSISGLSMYCSGHGVTGIATHGQIQKQIGRCQGCPIYFNLQPSERIVSMWLRMPAHGTPVENEPSILVTTNFDRSCIFGPSLSQSLVTACRYAWTPLTQNSIVLGMFNDVLAVQRCSRMTNIGIAQDVEVQPEFHTEELPRISFPHHRPGIPQSVGTGTYFSESKLDQISSLRVCQRGVRYMGMSIQHYGGRIDVVGQWDCQYSIREIYNPTNGALSSIIFRLSKGASGFYVDGIFVVADGADFPKIIPTNQSRLVCLELPSERSLAWWFTRDYDEVEPWDAVYKDIDVSTENYSIVELK